MTNSSISMSSPPAAASLLVVQAAGASSLDLSEVAPESWNGVGTMSLSPVASSPWASSTCNSPWSPATPAVMPKSACSPFFPGQRQGLEYAASGQTRIYAAVTPTSRAALGHSPVAMSPGAEIRRNAASFGIPLVLRARPGEVAAPVPVIRTAAGIVAPSPVARGGPVAGFHLAHASARGQELRVIRSIVTPLSREMAAAALPRRAAGGA
mmetsp:Transcript_12781/g.37999  ORF Transcript_12781/g.37999 Transcript_12781/m.37999 type:complete len:210 (-) Transcript_12781:172-801(-)